MNKSVKNNAMASTVMQARNLLLNQRNRIKYCTIEARRGGFIASAASSLDGPALSDPKAEAKRQKEKNKQRDAEEKQQRTRLKKEASDMKTAAKNAARVEKEVKKEGSQPPPDVKSAPSTGSTKGEKAKK